MRETDFDVEGTVAEYRRMIGLRDQQTAEIDRAEYDAIARRLRQEWKARNGDDELHEMAFGEPREP